ncbi:hypothetical protein V8E54_000602 [Elaphomyces granulatus]
MVLTSAPATSNHLQAAKQYSKWSALEESILVELQGQGKSWENISKNLPGRSATSCQFYWLKLQKTSVDILYTKWKGLLWEPIARQMGIPAQVLETWHWCLGEQEMAQRAMHSFRYSRVKPACSLSTSLSAQTLTAARLGSELAETIILTEQTGSPVFCTLYMAIFYVEVDLLVSCPIWPLKDVKEYNNSKSRKKSSSATYLVPIYCN